MKNINDNTKITLTYKQLKELVSEASQTNMVTVGEARTARPRNIIRNRRLIEARERRHLAERREALRSRRVR